MIDLSEAERRTFYCPRCHRPILSRKGECIFCSAKFDQETVFSCPRCGALVSQPDEKCPGCKAPLTDSGIGPGTMTEKEVDALLSELEKLSGEIAKSIETGTEDLSAEEKEKLERKIHDMLELQISGAKYLGIRDALKETTKSEEVIPIIPAISPVPQKGRINGLERPGRDSMPSMVNGLKDARPSRRGLSMSLIRRRIVRRMPIWQFISILIVGVILILSIFSIIILNESPSEIAIDGDFSDWSSVSAYSFSDLLPELGLEISEARIVESGGFLKLYLTMQDALFWADDPSIVYVFIDSDRDPNTGYEVGSSMGADRLGIIAGWDGKVRSSMISHFEGNDRDNWSGWETSGYINFAQSGSGLEASIDLGNEVRAASSIIKLVTVTKNAELSTPEMTADGTIVAIQRPLIDMEVASIPNPTLFNISMIAMGVSDRSYTIQSTLSKDGMHAFNFRTSQVNSNEWTYLELSTDLSTLKIGESFSYRFFGSSTEFTGPIEILGDPASGYYLSLPGNITIDGLLADWEDKKAADHDDVPITNLDIDIEEFGAATQDEKHMFMVNVRGEALLGSEVPERISRPISDTPGSPYPRLRKTGEDLLQTFIDRDPDNLTGRAIQSGNRTLFADLMIEIYGRNGFKTSSSVSEWSESEGRWVSIGDIDLFKSFSGGLEYSVNKDLLGNLTSSEVIFFATDWRGESDNSWLGAALADPWVMVNAGTDYRSPDGISWTVGDSISLEPGDSIVDITVSPSREYVFATTNTGRSYRWWVGQSSSWSSILTNPISGVSDVVAISLCSNSSGFVLTANGYLYSASDLDPIPPTNDWTQVSQAGGGSFSDYSDLVWRAENTVASADLYALRYSQDTQLWFTSDGGSGWGVIGISTGAMENQTQMAVVAGTSDEIFVLGESGEIRYSDDSAGSWSSIGDLPSPGIGNFSKYVGISIDSFSNLWVITDTGYCYKSSNGGANFFFTGRPLDQNIIAITTPIPEFEALIIPIISIVALMLGLTRAKSRRRE